MFYYLYQITNLVNNKIYVGVHTTKYMNDGYMGSGTVIKSAIEKYGIDNFRKDILETFENAEAMYAREKEVVTEEFLSREDVYNLRRGGGGGFDYINRLGLNHNEASGRHPNTVKNYFTKEAGRRQYLTNKENKKGIYSPDFINPFTDSQIQKENARKAWSDSARLKRDITKKRNQCSIGPNNSQYGTMWITDGITNRKIKKNGILPEGWYKGRV